MGACSTFWRCAPARVSLAVHRRQNPSVSERTAKVPVSEIRSFDPNRVGHWAWRVWVAYYRREWGIVLVSAVGLVRAGFGMDWARTLRGAWLVFRANQLWAPHPTNDPDGARRCMERFYRLVAAATGEHLDTTRAARLGPSTEAATRPATVRLSTLFSNCTRTSTAARPTRCDAQPSCASTRWMSRTAE